MPVELYAAAAAVLSLLALVMGVLVYFRLRADAADDLTPRLVALAQANERLERALRDEAGRGREEAGTQAKALREEMAKLVMGFQDSVIKAMAEMQGLQKSQLEVFAGQLRDGIAGIDVRHKALREEVAASLKSLGEGVATGMLNLGQAQKERLEAVAKEIASLTHKHTEGQEALRKVVEERLDALRIENAQKLEQMRQVVDEKLQGTLEKRLGESFKMVSERLEQVHKGLGEMQSLASGVGDLKRVLTNVKTRGTWGEVQLGTLLDQVLTPEQYLRDAVCRQGSQERVEFAIRLPGRGAGDPEVLLPIDAKFPNEDYDRLREAAERADAEQVEQAARQLELRIKNSARDIRDKYVNPPQTTDFAILFLPTEGLYAEVLRRPGLADLMQRDYRVVLAGPTTLGALLNALQMGFRTLAIERRSSEVWDLLRAVRTEFDKYGVVLDSVKKKLEQASKTIDDAGIRQRAIGRKLRTVETMPEPEAKALLGLAGTLAAAEDDEAAEVS